MYQNDFANIDLLVEKVKNQDSQALWELFDYYKPIFQSSVNQVYKNYKTVEKEDLMSECIFILKYLCEKYDKNKSYFSYYLSTRIQPYLISKVKSKYIEKIDIVSLNHIDEIELADNYFVLDFSDTNDVDINDKIQQLPEIYQKAIDLFYFQDLTQFECATILNISQPAFNKRLKKSLRLLKDLLQNGYN